MNDGELKGPMLANPEQARLTCPRCYGKKELFAFWDGHREDGTPFSGAGMRKCDTCNGEGYISLEHNARIHVGKNRRADRLSRRMSLYEEAKRLGMTPAQLSAIEHGSEPFDIWRD